MSDKKPINAMYGTKMSLNLDKIKNKSKKEETEEVPVVEKVDEPVVEAPIEETTSEEVVEEVVEPAVEEAEEDVSEEVVEEVPKTIEKSVEENVEASTDYNIVDNLKKELSEKSEKLSNQSSELNYLTNKVIPRLKKENSELKSIKMELTDALEKSTRKYFDQLDISADLSNKIGKIGAESAVNKVRADKLESELDTIKEDYEAKIDDLKKEIDSIDLSELNHLKEMNQKLRNELKEVNDKLNKSKDENNKLSDEIIDLRNDLIEIGDYKEEVDRKNKHTIAKLKEENSLISAQLKAKESSYDKLANESNKTISDLRKQIAKLEEALEKESNKGLFNRFK
ncbi:hypothetical protein [Methanobrevibacter sp.]|uniref:hypothetical protein n=1 Tax=Methanobrevibacter sp. TaxID=66852 RepID=UPI0026DEE27D|nr:hypothetical protein [Methanobrevibacter sp.]MDO5859315.1 hypothetical protein [Methanobrevibacter sp.]